MKREEMVLACCSDLAGKVRGKAFSVSEFDKRLQRARRQGLRPRVMKRDGTAGERASIVDRASAEPERGAGARACVERERG